jgi:hypothetical protein
MRLPWRAMRSRPTILAVLIICAGFARGSRRSNTRFLIRRTHPGNYRGRLPAMAIRVEQRAPRGHRTIDLR